MVALQIRKVLMKMDEEQGEERVSRALKVSATSRSDCLPVMRLAGTQIYDPETL